MPLRVYIYRKYEPLGLEDMDGSMNVNEGDQEEDRQSTHEVVGVKIRNLTKVGFIEEESKKERERERKRATCTKEKERRQRECLCVRRRVCNCECERGIEVVMEETA